MTKELREDVDRIIRDVNMAAGSRVDEILALFDRYAAERENQVAKAFGGCTNCYGKGYATVNDRWHGYGTDGDIGGFEGHISGGNANVMKFCKCERGKQLSALKETTK